LNDISCTHRFHGGNVRTLLFLFALSFVGTAALAEAQDKIFAGVHVASTDPAAKHVVRLKDAKGHTFCSGVIYSANMIVTAGHCVAAVTGSVTIEFLDPGTSEVLATRVSNNPMTDTRYDYYDHDSQGLNRTGKYDFGAFAFEGGLPAGFEAVSFDGCDGRLTEGQSATTYGYGLTGRKAPLSADLKSATQTYIGIENDMLAFRPGDGQVCRGDSGGPIFARNAEGKLCWVGVNAMIHGLPHSPAARSAPASESGSSGCSTKLLAASTRFIREGGENIFETWSALAGMIHSQAPPSEASSFGGAQR
jgi:hypothetical protein